MADPHFHVKTKACRPRVAVKSSTYWVGVLRSTTTPEADLSTEDYLWIKASAKISGQKIWEQYRLKYPKAEDFILKYGTRVQDLSILMKDLDEYGDQVIAFEAVSLSEVDTRLYPGHQPLQLRNVQLTHPVPKTALDVESRNQGEQDKTSSFCLRTSPAPFQSPSVGSTRTCVSVTPLTNDGQGSTARPDPALVEAGVRQHDHTSGFAHSGSPITGQEVSRTAASGSQKDREPNGESHKEHSFHSQEVLEDAVPEALELIVLQGLTLLDNLKIPLLNLPKDPDAMEWVQQIGKSCSK